MIFGRALGQATDPTAAIGTAAASAACAGGGPFASLACATLANKALYNEGKLSPTPPRGRPCVSRAELKPGEVLEERPDGVWCMPRDKTQTCADLMAWKAREWKRLGRSPTEYPGGGGHYANPYGVIACREWDVMKTVNPLIQGQFKDQQGQVRVYGPMPWEAGGTSGGGLMFVAQLAPHVSTTQFPPGAFAVFDPSIGQYRILVAA